MAQTNYSDLANGHKLYIDAMRRLIRQRLTAEFGQRWWENGVIGSLRRLGGGDARRAVNLEQDARRHPGRDTIDGLSQVTSAAHPAIEDWRIAVLQVEKGVAVVPKGGVRVTVWGAKRG
jgi:hypothetical protein